MKFGRLTVIGARSATGHVLCRCECGVERAIWWWNLTGGKTKSCGCTRGPSRVTHGFAKRGAMQSEYKTWAHVVQRTTNEKCSSFANYGGRGITVDPRWLKFENFIEDMGKKSKGFELDRIDNDGPYCKSNCRWVSRIVNANNTRRTRRITHLGEMHSLAEWGRITGVKASIIAMRIDRLGWPVERALSHTKGA